MIKLGKLKIRLLEVPNSSRIHINFGRYKKGRKIDTWTIYNSIYEKHKPFLDEMWLDIQNKKAIGLNITLDKMLKRKSKKLLKK